MNIRIRCAAHNHEHVIFSSFAFDDELTIDVVPCPHCAAQQSVQPTGGTRPAPQSDTLADEFPALWDSRTPPTIG